MIRIGDLGLNEIRKTIDPQALADEVYETIGEISCSLRADYRHAIDALIECAADSPNEAGKLDRANDVLRCIAENDKIGSCCDLPRYRKRLGLLGSRSRYRFWR